MTPPSRRHEAAPWTRRDSWTVALLVALFVALRVVLLDADPPSQLPQGRGPWELLREGAAKAHEARNWALEGVWRTNAADNYQFWRGQSPGWVYPLAGFFRVFGTGLAELRVFSVIGATAGFVAFIALAAQRLRGWPLWLGTVLFGANYYYILYTRCGLLEPLVNTCWTLAMLALVAAWRRPLWLIGAHAALLAAFLVKMTGLLLVPVFAVATVIVLRDALRRGERRSVLVVVLALAALGVAGAVHVSTDDFQRAFAWNFGHYFGAGEGQQAVDATAVEGVSLLDRVLDHERYWIRGVALFPIMGLLGLVGVFDTAVAVRAGRREPWAILMVAWFLLAFASVIVGGDQGLRYRLILFPPAGLLAALAFDGLARERTPRERGTMAGAILALFLAVHGYWYSSWVMSPTYQVRDLNRELGAKVGPEATVLGGWAPWLLFDSTARFYYVKRFFNASPEALEALAPTHLLLRPKLDPARHAIERIHPGRLDELEPILSVAVFEQPLQLYDVRGRL